MKTKPSILTVIAVIWHFGANAQFFARVDDKINFNGIGLFDKTEYVKNCRVIEENETYRVWQPNENTCKAKGFTLHNIKIITSFDNEIWQIKAENTNKEEQLQILTDMAKKAKQSKDLSTSGVTFKYFRQEIRTENYFRQVQNNDTASIFIVIFGVDRSTEYTRENVSFMPLLGKPIDDPELRKFLFAYGIPDQKSGTDLKFLHYNKYGLMLFIDNNKLRSATVFSKNGNYEKYAYKLPFQLSLDDTKRIIKQKLGPPSSISNTGSEMTFLKDKFAITVRFYASGTGKGNDEDVRIEYISFRLKL
jgi:hypothetical protein